MRHYSRYKVCLWLNLLLNILQPWTCIVVLSSNCDFQCLYLLFNTLSLRVHCPISRCVYFLSVFLGGTSMNEYNPTLSAVSTNQLLLSNTWSFLPFLYSSILVSNSLGRQHTKKWQSTVCLTNSPATITSARNVFLGSVITVNTCKLVSDSCATKFEE